MASLNMVQLIGNLGRDPEFRAFSDGGSIASVRIATGEKWKDKKSGDMCEHTEWHNLVFHDRLAEIARDYLKKGSPIYIAGRLRTRKWQTDSGEDRYITEIRVDEMQMLGGKPEAAEPVAEAEPAAEDTTE